MKIYGRADVQEVTIPQPCYRCREYEGRALPKPGCRDCEIEPAHVHKKKAKQHRIEVDCAECEQHLLTAAGFSLRADDPKLITPDEQAAAEAATQEQGRAAAAGMEAIGRMLGQVGKAPVGTRFGLVLPNGTVLADGVPVVPDAAPSS